MATTRVLRFRLHRKALVVLSSCFSFCFFPFISTERKIGSIVHRHTVAYTTTPNTQHTNTHINTDKCYFRSEKTILSNGKKWTREGQSAANANENENRCVQKPKRTRMRNGSRLFWKNRKIYSWICLCVSVRFLSHAQPKTRYTMYRMDRIKRVESVVRMPCDTTWYDVKSNIYLYARWVTTIEQIE